ncbi:MAG: hypothetical protein J5634_00075 [Bacilli bacterium]|nr:hypothetical protein [Bacilli bacterium]
MKKKIIMMIIFASAFLALLILLIFKGFGFNKDKDIKIVVKNGLSINYLDGDEIKSTNKNNVYRFSITNDSSDDKYYQISIKDLDDAQNITYSITCDETKLNKTDNSFINNSIVDYAVIIPGETHTYTLTVSQSFNDIKIGTLDIDEYTFIKEYFSQSIISNSTIYQKPKTNVGTEISQIDEGLIQDLDDDGVTYYFRGNVTNNYFKFADMMWRIVRINGNNTIKVVLDSTTGDTVEYYNETGDDYFKYVNTNIKTYLNEWYNENLKMYDKYIYAGKLCDYTLYTGKDQYIFEASQRLGINHTPTFNCLGSKLTSKIMLLTADEIEYAGGLIGVSNDSYYLYKSDIVNPSWTITPASGNASEFYPYALSNNGSIDDSIVGNQQKNIRPVINISKNVVVSGDGTIDNPYEIVS